MGENAKALDHSKTLLAEAEQRSVAQKAEAERKTLVAQQLKELLEQQNSALQEQLKSTLGRMAAMVDGQDAKAVQEQIKKLRDQIDLNAKNYAESQNQIAELAKGRPEQEKILEEKEKALADARSEAEKLRSDLSCSEQKVAALQQEQTQRQERLRQLQKDMDDLTKSRPEQEKAAGAARQEIDRLQAELTSANGKLVALSQQGGGEDRLRQLQNQLATRDAEIARLKKRRESKSAPDEKTEDENTLLRGIVLRELKDEAKRVQARRLMEEELKHLNVQSQSLAEQISVLAAPIVRLAPKEKALFKDAQLVVAEESPEKLQASVAAPKSDGGERSPTASETPAPASVEHKGESGKEATRSEISWQGELKKTLARAKEEFDRQDYLQAESSFQEALKISPDDYFALSNLGVVEFQLNKFKEAEESLKKASEKSSDSSFALTTLGIVHYRQGRLDDAETVLRKSVTINPLDFTAHNYLGIVLAAAGKSKAGESEIMKSLEINPNYADAYFNLAVINATSKPPFKSVAKKHYRKAVELGAPPDASLEQILQ